MDDLKDSIKMYRLQTTQKNVVASIAVENGMDPELMEDELLDEVTRHVNEVILRMNNMETDTEKRNYLLTVIVMSFMAILQPAFLGEE